MSKEAADMVLADDNFASIVAAVEEGRAIFANIRKFLRYLLSSNIGEVMTMFFGVLLARQIGLHADGGGVVLPLLATQILWINLVTDGPPALALGVDPADEGLMQPAARPAGEGVITPRMWRGIVFVGVIMAAGTLFVLDAVAARRVRRGRGRSALCADDGVHDADAVSDLQRRQCAIGRAKRVRPSVHERLAMGGGRGFVALQVLVVYCRFFSAPSDRGLSGGDWLFCVAVASSVLWLREVSKIVARGIR